MQRQLQSELLDSLSPTDPAALHSRRDLRLINQAMGNHRWFLRALPRILQRTERAVEIGAGTGELGVRLAARGWAVDGIDLWPRPPQWPEQHAWQSADLLSFDGYKRYEAVIGNLIFHQFSSEDLAALGRRLQGSVRVILASEPSRRNSSQKMFALLGPLFGVNHVTLHDAHVSIAAGFQGEELPQLLGLPPAGWNWRCHSTWSGAYRMIAWRRDSR